MSTLKMQQLEEKIAVHTDNNPNVPIMCEILSDTPKSFNLSLVEETKESDLPTFYLDGERTTYWYPVFALYKARKQGKLPHRYALVQYNKSEFGQGSYVLVDCDTGKITKSYMFIGMISNPSVRQGILEGTISSEILKSISQTNGYDSYLPITHPTIDIKALLESAWIHCNETHAPKGYCGMLNERFADLVGSIDHIQRNKSKSIADLLGDISIIRREVQ